jgi:hypothetical protein
MDTDTVPWPDSGVVILGYSVARAPIAAKLLLAASSSLFVVDDVAVSANSELGRVLRALADHSDQVIFTRAQLNAWFPPHETRRWTYPLSDILGRRLAPHVRVRVRNYEEIKMRPRPCGRPGKYFTRLDTHFKMRSLHAQLSSLRYLAWCDD